MKKINFSLLSHMVLGTSWEVFPTRVTRGSQCKTTTGASMNITSGAIGDWTANDNFCPF